MKLNMLLLIVAGLFISCNAEKQYNVLLVTGGHGFDETTFFDVFESLEDVTYTHVPQPKANEMIASANTTEFDVLVFYDMYDSITTEQQQAYIELLDQGKGMVFMHHALVSYQGWKEFKNIIGGKYYQDSTMVDGKMYKSTYKHDVTIDVRVTGTEHPITNGITDFTIFDEVYGNCEILSQVKPLLSTDHPESMEHIAWVNPYKNSQIVYIQLGHGPEAFANENFRTLVRQAIQWSAKKHERL